MVFFRAVTLTLAKNKGQLHQQTTSNKLKVDCLSKSWSTSHKLLDDCC